MKHALVIEDRFLIAMMIQDALLSAGFGTAEIARSQGDAIKSAEEQCPDLITVDESLDGGSGIAAIREICRNKCIPVVFIVADGSKVRRAIPDAVVLLKPFSDAALADALQRATAVHVSSA